MPQLPALATGGGSDIGRTLMMIGQMKAARRRNRLLEEAGQREERRQTAKLGLEQRKFKLLETAAGREAETHAEGLKSAAFARTQAQKEATMRAGLAEDVGAGEDLTKSPALAKYMAMFPGQGEKLVKGFSALDEQKQKQLAKQQAEIGAMLVTVAEAPPEQRPMLYAQALGMAEDRGIPTQSAPQQYDPNWVKSQIILATGIGEHYEQLERDRKAKKDVVKVMTPQGPRYVSKDEAAGKEPYEEPITVGEKQRLVDPTTQDVLLEAAAPAEGEGADFGKGIRGRSLAILTNDAESFRAGLLSPEEEQRFVSAAYEYRQPQQFTDPDTGLVQTRRSELPPYIAQAFQERGMELPAERQPGSATAPGGLPVEAAPAAPAAPGGGIIPEAAAAEAPGTAAAPAAPAVGPEQKVFDLAFATGPVPAAGRALARTPGIGQFVDTPQWTQAQKFMEGARDDLTRVLQNSPRYAQGERNQIREEIADVTARVWDDPSAFRDRLIGVDDFLQIRLRNALKTASSNRVSAQERRHAMDIANGIENFRGVLGVPQRVRTIEEARQLPPGSRFIDPSGKLRVVPEAQ